MRFSTQKLRIRVSLLMLVMLRFIEWSLLTAPTHAGQRTWVERAGSDLGLGRRPQTQNAEPTGRPGDAFTVRLFSTIRIVAQSKPSWQGYFFRNDTVLDLTI